ncbi:hypothetical protein PybrP1_003599 [[Pythium] brassicae (nom. inval.)]|nr:hypothetical protein PybrP1_003599 [[Pythium] brassicae (nom. inval.)]
MTAYCILRAQISWLRQCRQASSSRPHADDIRRGTAQHVRDPKRRRRRRRHRCRAGLAAAAARVREQEPQGKATTLVAPEGASGGAQAQPGCRAAPAAARQGGAPELPRVAAGGRRQALARAERQHPRAPAGDPAGPEGLRDGL